jgi:hypothetical protein
MHVQSGRAWFAPKARARSYPISVANRSSEMGRQTCQRAVRRQLGQTRKSKEMKCEVTCSTRRTKDWRSARDGPSFRVPGAPSSWRHAGQRSASYGHRTKSGDRRACTRAERSGHHGSQSRIEAAGSGLTSHFSQRCVTSSNTSPARPLRMAMAEYKVIPNTSLASMWAA